MSKTVPSPSEVTRLRAAFRQMRKDGLNAKQNVPNRAVMSGVPNNVFYDVGTHHQWLETGILYINFQADPDDVKTWTAHADQVLATLHEYGLNVCWSGEYHDAILVKSENYHGHE